MKYLNEFPIKETGNVFKYQKAEVAILCLNQNAMGTGTLQFSRPSEWKDPTERAFYNAEISPQGVIETSRVYACCITKAPLSEAAWITYQYGANDGCVKFSIIFNLFTKEVEKWAKNNGFKFYIGETIYDEWEVIKKIGRADFVYKDNIFTSDASTMETFLRTLLLKRKAFEYEKEIRLFLVNEGTEDKGKTLLIDIDWKRCLNDTIYYSNDCRVGNINILRERAHAIDKQLEQSTIYNEKEPLKYSINTQNTYNESK